MLTFINILMNVIDLEKKTQDKIEQMPADPVEAVGRFLSARPVGSKNKEIIRQDLELFQAIIAKLQ